MGRQKKAENTPGMPPVTLDEIVKWFFPSQFHFGLLKRYGFWKVLWQGVKAHFGNNTVVICRKEAYSVGLTSPDERLWNKGWRVSMAGRVLGKVVLLYERT